MKVAGMNYLQDCLEAFQEVSEKKYGTRFDLWAIEQSVAHLRDHRPLTYEELRQFESPGHWGFSEKFWVFPPAQHVTPALKNKKFNFWQLPAHEEDVITSLLDVFKSIELVSIILRFIRPEYYGIISPPVERILDVRRGGSAVETYLNYLEELREVQKHYRFRRASEVDMALWVLHERCYGSLRDPDIEKAYNSDDFLRRLRAKNIMVHFLGKYSYTELADSLLPVNLELAAQIAGIAFERMVRNIEPDSKHKSRDDRDLKDLINDLRARGVIDSMRSGLLHKHRNTRNRAIHGATPPTRKDVELLIQSLNEV